MRIAFILDNIILGQEPLGVTSIGAVLKKAGHTVGYFEIPREREHWSTDAAVNYQPDLVGYSISTGLHNRYMAFNRMLKARIPDFRTIVGGPHPSYFPEFIHTDTIDFLCVGEGEWPTLELVTALEEGRSPLEIAGLHVKLPDGSIQTNSPRPYERNLDAFPYPDHSIMYSFPHLRESPIAYLMAGRGCPYNCTFCFNHVAQDLQAGRYIRFRSPENVIGECLELRDRFSKRFMAFQDDTFSLNYRYLDQLLPLYAEKVGLPYLVHLRADNLTLKMADLLAETGCKRAVIGLENGFFDIRYDILSKNISDEQIIRCGELLHERGIELLTQNMFGVPGETVESALSTIELNIRCKVDVMVIHFYQPYPGTKLAQVAVDMGLWEGTVDDIPEDNHWYVVLDLKDKEMIDLIGKLSYFMLDYPKVFHLLKPLAECKATRKLALPLLKLCRWFDLKTIYTKVRGPGSRWYPPKEIQAVPETVFTEAARSLSEGYCAPV